LASIRYLAKCLTACSALLRPEEVGLPGQPALVDHALPVGEGPDVPLVLLELHPRLVGVQEVAREDLLEQAVVGPPVAARQLPLEGVQVLRADGQAEAVLGR
jgi:hypothetical protein